MSFSDYFVDKDISVSAALSQLERIDHKILFIAPDSRLEAVLTDGDIRRYVLAGSDIQASVTQAAYKSPLSLSGYHEAAARAMLTEKAISCVPMTDRTGCVHALVFANETLHRENPPVDTPVILMAGGLGTRLYPYTEILPKPLIPVGSVTITEQILNRFKKFGCYDFYLVVNHKKNLIKSYFSEVDTGANIRFIDEDKPLGTGGGLSFFKGQFDGPVIVTCADSVIEADYGELLEQHRRENNIFTMVCAKKRLAVPYGVIETAPDGSLQSLLEKPGYDFLVNTGLYVVSPAFIDRVPADSFVPITDVVNSCLADGKRVGVYTVAEDCFIDIGQLDDLRAVEDKLR